MQVRIKKTLNRYVKKNKIGVANKEQVETFGIGNDFIIPHNIDVKIDNVVFSIPNIYIEAIK